MRIQKQGEFLNLEIKQMKQITRQVNQQARHYFSGYYQFNLLPLNHQTNVSIKIMTDTWVQSARSQDFTQTKAFKRKK